MHHRGDEADRDRGRILVINPNTSEATTELLVAVANDRLAALGRTDLVAVGVTAAAGPSIITDPGSLAAAAPEVVRAAVAEIAVHPPLAIVVGAIGDPGLHEVRALAGVPVVGIGASSVLAAAADGLRFAIITTTELLAASLVDLVARTAPDADFAGVHLTRSPAAELVGDPDEQTEQLREAAESARTAGATVLVVGGGPLSGSARVLAASSDLAVVEPVPAAIDAVVAALALVPAP